MTKRLIRWTGSLTLVVISKDGVKSSEYVESRIAMGHCFFTVKKKV